MPPSLNQLELMTLLALVRLGPDAYGVTIREEIATVTGRDVSMAAVYAALERLSRQGLLTSRLGEPRPERGGRARTHYELTAGGERALREERAAMDRLWQGVSLREEGRS